MTSQQDNGTEKLSERVERLERRLDEMSKSLAFSIEKLSQDNSSTVWTYDARFPAQHSNIYEAEYWDTIVKRWVGPEPKLEFAPNLRGNRNYLLVARIPDFITPDAEREFRISVNGIRLRFRELATRVFEAEFFAVSDGEQILTFETSVAETPQLIFGTDDMRKLAFSISSVSVVEKAGKK